MKKIIALAIAVLMLAALITVPTFAEELEFVAPDENWAAAEDGVFYIADAADLLAFSVSAQINSYYVGQTVKLTEDIDMTGIEWFPVAKFMGTLDGDGHAIKGVSVTAQSGTLGFITSADSATFQNIRFLDFATTIATNGGGTAGLVVGATAGSGTITFKNVYVSGTSTTASHRAGGFVGHTNGASNLVFENCVGNVTCIGKRAGVFLSHLNPGAGVVTITDCVAMGDLTQAGDQTGAFVGVTGGHLTMERCISLVNLEGASKEAGAFFLLDHQGAASVQTLNPVINVTDCYAAVDAEHYAFAMFTGRGWPFKLTVKYDGQTVYEKNSTEESTLNADREVIEAATKYYATPNTVNVTKANFATKMTAFTGWVDAGMTATYMTGKTVDVFVPASVKTLMDAPFTPKVEEQPNDTEPTDTQPTETQPTETQPQVTEPQATETQANATETQANTAEGGCASAIGVSALAVFALAGGAMMIARKRRED